MALTVATNTGALMAQAAASSVNKEMEISMERLSTGKRINGASDDAAGVAIASRLTSEITGTNQAIRNAMDGQALIDTAEGAHAEVENILQRMRELAVQASNDTNDTTDRSMLQAELDSLIDEIDRISETTAWAGKELLDGTASAINLQIGSGTSGADSVTVSIGSLATDGDIMEHTTNGNANLATYKSDATSGTIPATFSVVFSDATGDAVTDEMSMSYNTTTGVVDVTNIADADADNASIASMTVTVNGTAVVVATTSLDTAADFAGAFADIFTADDTVLSGVSVDEDNVSAGRIILEGTSASSDGGLSTVALAKKLINTIDGVLENLNAQRASLGAISNRLDSTVSNLTNISSNLQAGRGRIEDADFAAETTTLAKSQILQQASTAMLAQANASKQNVLSLLQG